MNQPKPTDLSDPEYIRQERECIMLEGNNLPFNGVVPDEIKRVARAQAEQAKKQKGKP